MTDFNLPGLRTLHAAATTPGDKLLNDLRDQRRHTGDPSLLLQFSRELRGKAADRIEAQDAEIARLRERLEIPEPPFEHCDGIDCRDETIRNQDAKIAALRAQNKALAGALQAIEIYGTDTLTGPTCGIGNANWYRVGVTEMRNRARAALKSTETNDE